MRASFVALAGTIAAVVGVVISMISPPIGLFFVVLGGAILLASPVIGLVRWWDERSEG